MQLKNVPFVNVGANQTATLDLLQLIQGKVLDRVVLVLGGTFTKSQITGLRIKANGKIIFDDTGDRIDKRHQYRGHTANANYLTVDLSEVKAKDLLDEKLGSMDLSKDSGITSLTMEVDIGGATNPTLVAYSECSWQNTQVQAAADLIGKVLNYPHQCNATANKYPVTIPFGKQGGSLIKRIHLFPGAGITINGFEVRKNGVTIFDQSIGVNNYVLTEKGRVPQSGVFHCDFVSNGNFLGEILDAANANSMEYYVDVTVSSPGLINVVTEMLDTLANN